VCAFSGWPVMHRRTMKSSFAVLRRLRFVGLCALLPALAAAQSSDFTGIFDPSAWTFSSGGTPANVVWSGSSSFTLSGSNAAAGATAFASTTTLQLSLSDAYRVSFDWSYSTGDGAPFDPAGYISSATNTQLTDNAGDAMAQSGTASNVYFGTGASGFYIFSTDNQFGAATLVITNFSYTLAAPGDTGDGGGGGGGGGSGSPYSGTTYWTSATGNWTTSANWSGGEPTADLQASITDNATVDVTTAVVAHSVYLENSALTITGNGSLTQANAYAAFSADYGAVLTVSGTGASWDNAGYISLFTATATFDQGATVTTHGGTLALFDDNIATLNVRNGASWSGGDFSVGYAGQGTLNIESGATVTLGETTVGDASGSQGTLNVTGVGTVLTTGFLKLANFAQGTLTISGGAVVTSTSAAIANGSVNGAGDVIGTATVTGSGSRWEITNDLSISTYIDAATFNFGTVTIADGGLVKIGPAGTGTLNIDRNGTLNIGIGDAAGVLQAGTVSFTATTGTAALIAFNHSDNITFASTITGRGRLTKAGAGTLALTGTNDYTQNTTVTAGTLQLGNGGTTGSITGDIAVSSDATLAFKRSNNLTFAGVISGAGNVAQTGSGVLTLSGTNTYSGGTRIDSGTLSVSSNANLGNASGGVTLAGGSLRLSNNSATSFDRAVTVTSDSGVVSNRSSNGAGVTHTLGTLSIGANTLSVTRGSSATSGTGGITFGTTTLTGNATFNVGSNARLNLGAISGSYGFTKSGSGNLTLSGTHTYTGLTAIDAGTLALAAGASLANSSTIRVGSGATFDVAAVSGGFTLASGQTLGGSGSVNGLVTAASGSHLAPGSSPGTITFTGGLGLNASAFLDFELGTTSDKIRVSGGTLTGPVSGKITVNLSDSGGFTAGTYTLIDATGATLTSISATSFNLGTTIAGYSYTFSQTGNLFQLTATAVPEPAAFAALAGLGTLTLAAFRRRRAKLASSDPSA
jgi:fibronectin-binding autotransporter adhesin